MKQFNFFLGLIAIVVLTLTLLLIYKQGNNFEATLLIWLMVGGTFLSLFSWWKKEKSMLWISSILIAITGLLSLFLPLLDPVERRQNFQGFGGFGYIIFLILIPLAYLIWFRSLRHQSLSWSNQVPLPTDSALAVQKYLPAPLFLFGALLILIGVFYFLFGGASLILKFNTHILFGTPVGSMLLFILGGTLFIRRKQAAFYILGVAILLLIWTFPLPPYYLILHLFALIGLYLLIFRSRWFRKDNFKA